MKIPVYQPDLSGNEKKYVNECLDTTWISSKGKFVTEFETCFANYVGIEHAISVSNGTVALHLALLALDIHDGDEVIVPTFTYIASVNAISYTGATPVFVDACEGTWQLDVRKIEQRISKNTKAIMVVHLYGQPCDMDSIMKIANKYNLKVIEDCAEAFGASYKGKAVGTFGDIAAYSFFGNKTITCGEGGMVITNNSETAKKARNFKNQGVSEEKQYWHDAIGYNYRMTNIAAAIGLAQLERADELLAKKRRIAKLYIEKLKDLPVECHAETVGTVHSFWMCSCLVKNESERDNLRDYLSGLGIETRPLFFPVHLMDIYSGKLGDFPVAENIGLRGLNLPSWPGLTEEDIAYICQKIREFFS